MEDPLNVIDFSKYMFADEVTREFKIPLQGLTTKEDNALANIQIVNNQIVNTICDKYIFINLNSDKEINTYLYNKVIKKVMTQINKNKKTNMICQWYFEDKTKYGDPCRLHVHGMISNVPETFYPYEGLVKYISHQFHKEIGRPKVTHSVAAYIEWARSNEAVADYSRKQKGQVRYFVQNKNIII